MIKKIYIGGGFSDDQLIWVIPIIANLLKKNKNTELFFENKIPKKITNNKIIRKYLKNFKIRSKSELYFFDSKLIKYLLILLKNIFEIFLFTFFINRSNILNDKKNWYKLQIFHGFWDLALNLSKDGEIRPNTKNKFYSILKCLNSIELGKKIYAENISLVFLGHTVYANRALLAFLRKKNIKVYTQAAFNIHKQHKKIDNSWHFISSKKLSFVTKKLKSKEILKYFVKRKSGKGNYLDSKSALRGVKNDKKLDNFNTLFLHVFRDSPYNVIDKDRIFVDYFDWVINTLKILQDSKEKWIIRYHPSHLRWGENQNKTLLSIIKNAVGKKKLRSNFIIDKGKYSNDFLIRNSTKIVTFNGTVQLETACYGKKSISIMSYLKDQNLSFCPRKLKTYRKLLLLDKSLYQNISHLSPDSILKAKYILYIIENIHYMKKDLNGTEIYRNDGKHIRNKNFNKIAFKLKQNQKLFEKNSIYLKNGGSHTLTTNFIEYFIKSKKFDV